MSGIPEGAKTPEFRADRTPLLTLVPIKGHKLGRVRTLVLVTVCEKTKT